MIRLLSAAALFSAWLVLLLSGVILGGWIHDLLILALAAFPWRALRSDATEEERP